MIFSNNNRRSSKAFTLAEVCICLLIATIVFTSILLTYMQSSYRTEWSAYSLAAQALSLQQLEQARSAKWDVMSFPGVDELTNLPATTANVLDIPVVGTNVTWATNFVTVSSVQIATNPIVSVHMVKVDTKWPFIRKGQKVWFTNTVASYYAPDR
jgi:type II secretory pathway pseudopilin PulG